MERAVEEKEGRDIFELSISLLRHPKTVGLQMKICHKLEDNAQKY